MKKNSFNSHNSDGKNRYSEKHSNYGGKKSSSKSKNSQQNKTNPYLSSEVTTLGMKSIFAQTQQKKLNEMRSRQSQLTNAASQYLSYQQNCGLQNYYTPPNSFYTGLDSNTYNLMNTELPSLMSVAPYKQIAPERFDMSHISDELFAVMSDGITELPVGVAMEEMPKSSRNNGNRKNRMVEMKTIDDGTNSRSVFVVSDPMAATASNRSTIVQATTPRPPNILANIETCGEPLYSRKVFIGGLPIDVTEEEVWTTFAAFGKVLVDWPRRPENRRNEFFDMDMQPRRNSRSVSGYVFLVFQNEYSVRALVNSCEIFNKKFYLELSSPTMSGKAVQVRAWNLSDIDYFADNNAPIDHRRTVFIGGVPRPTRAVDLARCLEKHYGKVSYVGIDIDPELKYPKGAARVTFAYAKSFVAAISGRFVHVVHSDTNKRVEIKPYVMEDQICDECEGKICNFNYAPYFCGDASCLQYYCEKCWDRIHYVMSPARSEHRPMVRTGDQTRVLPRPPHHPQNGSRSYPIAEQYASVISRVTAPNTHHTSMPLYQKQFSATPTSIGF
ncbi:unnamed protein product [Caenorhabditis bovis]|uniref:Cytoplasmic polyadenylation element-binding protein 1 n=1 Tax=Caenorhabditis bovis TaxID=2654633 RepID=A0A8S1F4Q1_9PELO|nr:unnamed protein product [Caenorhabditis bovis]